MKAIIGHIATVYDAILKASKTEVIEGTELKVYRGAISKLYSSLSVPQSYYAEIFKQLIDQECLTYLQRGSKSAETVIVLHHPPSEEGYRPPRKEPGLTTTEEYANLLEQHELLVKLVGGMDIVEALRVVDERLGKLERAVSAGMQKL